MSAKIGRNDQCPCGSGKKYKHCCLVKQKISNLFPGVNNLDEELKKYRSMVENWDHANGPVPSFMESRGISNTATDALKELTRKVGDRVFQSEEEMRTFINQQTHSSNNAPQKDFLGLSSAQMNSILNREFAENTSLVEVSDKIPDELLEGIPALKQCLFLLHSLSEPEKGIKATRTGKFPRILVQELYKKHIEEHVYYKTTPMKEEDVIEIQKLRFFMTDSGLIKKRNGWFTLTRKGQDLLKNVATYEIFKMIFYYFSEGYNWLYGTRYHENFGFVQDSLIFCLYLLKIKAADFISGNELAAFYKQAFPQIVEPIDTMYVYKIFDSGFFYLFLTQFALFLGLVEKRGERTASRDDVEFRITELFKRFFVWKM